VPRDDDARSTAKWSEPAPDADPHRDVTGALHDVSNVLTVLLGWAAEARSASESPAQLERALAIIEEKAREARDVARCAIGAQTSVDARDASLDDIIAGVMEALSVEAQKAGVKLVVSSRAAGTRVAGAADLSRVLTNLVLNAIAWTPRAGRVGIDVDADPAAGYVTVKDDGPGVEPASVPRLFDGVKSTRKGGAGVGLKHARAVARAAGGELELLSRADGDERKVGARFRLRWPRIEPSPAGQAPLSSQGNAVLAGSRVLVVEDDEDVAALLESALEARGARVVVARNADELVRLAESEHDAALVDLSPIAQDVPGALEALRRGSPGLALVFISGSAVGMPEGLEGAGVRWVRKPFEVSEIVAALVEPR
jgi:CheY-like chemotaxis protein